MNAPDDYREYEKLVHRALEERLRKECTATEVGVFHDRKYRGASGHEHQIDISAEVVLAGCRILILAECKRYSARVNNADVLEFVGRLRDIGAHKGIIVTTVGYQEGAMRIAEANRVALVLTPAIGTQSWDVIMPALVAPILIEVTAKHRLFPNQQEPVEPTLGPRKVSVPSAPIEISWPATGSGVGSNLVIHGTVRGSQPEVWVIVHPSQSPHWWVQPAAVVHHDGAWTCEIFVGLADDRSRGLEFEIQAVGNPRLELARGLLLSHRPEAEVASTIVRVVRT